MSCFLCCCSLGLWERSGAAEGLCAGAQGDRVVKSGCLGAQRLRRSGSWRRGRVRHASWMAWVELAVLVWAFWTGLCGMEKMQCPSPGMARTQNTIWCVNREIVLFSFFSVPSSPREGMLKGSLKRQVACLWIIFYFSFFLSWVHFGAGPCPAFLAISHCLCRTPGGGETVLSEVLDWLFRPTSVFLWVGIIGSDNCIFKGLVISRMSGSMEVSSQTSS